MPKEKENKEISKENLKQYKKENKEIDNIKKEIEKEIGNDLLKEVINLLYKNCDKNDLKFDRELKNQKVLELLNKRFDEEKVNKFIERLDEIFAVLIKDKLFA